MPRRYISDFIGITRAQCYPCQTHIVQIDISLVTAMVQSNFHFTIGKAYFPKSFSVDRYEDDIKRYCTNETRSHCCNGIVFELTSNLSMISCQRFGIIYYESRCWNTCHDNDSIGNLFNDTMIRLDFGQILSRVGVSHSYCNSLTIDNTYSFEISLIYTINILNIKIEVNVHRLDKFSRSL